MILTREKGMRMWGGGGGSSYSYGGGGGGESSSFDGFVSNEYYNQNFELLYKQEVTAGGTTTTTFMTAAPNIIVPVGTVTDETTQTTTVTSLVGPVAKNAIVLGNIMMVYDQTNNAIKVVNRDGSTAANFYATGGVSALGYSPGGGGGGGADLNLLLDNINSSNIGNIAPTASEVGKCLVYNGNNQWAWATPGGGGGGGIDNVSVASTGLLTGGSVSGSSLILNTRAIQASDLPDLSATYVKWTSVNRTSYSSWDKIPFVNASGSMDIGKTLEFHSSNGDSTDYNAVLMLDSSKTYNAVSLTLPNTSGTLATQTWVNQQGFVKSSGVTSVGLSMPTGFTVSGSPVTSSGTLSVEIANGYFIPTTTQRTTWNNKQDAISDLATIRSNAANGHTAYGWGNHANVGYMLRTEGMRFTDYGSYIAARFVLADGTYDATRAAKAQGSGFIEWWSDGGYFNHHMGSVSISDGGSETTCYLQIGGGRIYWDPSSKSFYVVQSDGSTPANIFATGGVSALGISTGGSPSVSALTVGTLTARALNMSGDINANGGNLDMGDGDIDNVNQVNTSNLNVNGTTISRIYWNGTYLQVQIGSNTYNFRPV